MAQRVITEFLDDIDGSPAERTFTFAVDGTNYQIDLSAENIAEFKSAIGGFIESARKVKGASNGRRPRSAGVSGGQQSREQTQAVRSGPVNTVTSSAIGAGSRPRSSRRSTKRTQPLSRYRQSRVSCRVEQPAVTHLHTVQATPWTHRRRERGPRRDAFARRSWREHTGW
jgi:hypothetical protein